MLQLGHCTDPLRGEDCQRTEFLEEVKGSDPEEQTELLKREDVGFGEFVVDVGEVAEEVLGGVEVEQGVLVDVAPAAFVVHEADGVVEDGSDLVEVGVVPAQTADGPVDHRLRLLQAAEKRKQLVYQVRLTIFFGTL